MTSPDRPWQVRTLAPEEWQLLRDLRIRAIRDAPDAFRPTLDEVLGESDQDWMAMAATLAHTDCDLLIACRNNSPEGTTFVRAQDSIGHVGAMWVDPLHRQQGVGQLLFNRALDWHRSAGMTSIELSVTEGNYAAQRLYERRGFALTGATELLKPSSPLRVLVMSKQL